MVGNNTFATRERRMVLLFVVMTFGVLWEYPSVESGGNFG